jgi:hypothetical protein
MLRAEEIEDNQQHQLKLLVAGLSGCTLINGKHSVEQKYMENLRFSRL